MLLSEDQEYAHLKGDNCLFALFYSDPAFGAGLLISTEALLIIKVNLLL
jgi:hypothetical protein